MIKIWESEERRRWRMNDLGWDYQTKGNKRIVWTESRERTVYQGAVRAVLREKFIILGAYNWKEYKKKVIMKHLSQDIGTAKQSINKEYQIAIWNRKHTMQGSNKVKIQLLKRLIKLTLLTLT